MIYWEVLENMTTNLLMVSAHRIIARCLFILPIFLIEILVIFFVGQSKKEDIFAMFNLRKTEARYSVVI